MFAIKFIINVLIFYLFFSFLVGCTAPNDPGCVPIHIGTGYDEDGMMEAIYVNEIGCPPVSDNIY
jgi:hypothetical protein|tara:strand:+ start:327 stop:521 length:195 start_codon:yes stop_codon:yes gene_type:complete